LLSKIGGQLEILQKLLKWGKGEPAAEELNYNFLLKADRGEQTAWHLAGKRDQRNRITKVI
jgi:hypothetical protein